MTLSMGNLMCFFVLFNVLLPFKNMCFKYVASKTNEKDLKYRRKNRFEIEDTYGGNNEIKCTYGDCVMKKYFLSKHHT